MFCPAQKKGFRGRGAPVTQSESLDQSLASLAEEKNLIPEGAKFLIKVFDPNGNVAHLEGHRGAFVAQVDSVFLKSDQGVDDFLRMFGSILSAELLLSSFSPRVPAIDLFSTVCGFYNRAENQFFFYFFTMPKTMTSDSRTVDLLSFAKQFPQEWLDKKIFEVKNLSFIELKTLRDDGWVSTEPLLTFTSTNDGTRVRIDKDLSIIDTEQTVSGKVSSRGVRRLELLKRKPLEALCDRFMREDFPSFLARAVEDLNIFKQGQKSSVLDCRAVISNISGFVKESYARDRIIVSFMPNGSATVASINFTDFDLAAQALFSQIYQLSLCSAALQNISDYQARVALTYKLINIVLNPGGELRAQTFLSMREGCVVTFVPARGNPQFQEGPKVLICADPNLVDCCPDDESAILYGQHLNFVSRVLIAVSGGVLSEISRSRNASIAEPVVLDKPAAQTPDVSKEDRQAKKEQKQAEKEAARIAREQKKKMEAEVGRVNRAFEKQCEQRATLIKEAQAVLLAECEARKSAIYGEASGFVEQQRRAAMLESSVLSFPQEESEARGLILAEHWASMLEIEIHGVLLDARTAFFKTEKSRMIGTREEIFLQEGSGLKAALIKAQDTLKQMEQLVPKAASASTLPKHKGKKVCFQEPLDNRLARLKDLQVKIKGLAKIFDDQLAGANQAICTIIQRRKEGAAKKADKALVIVVEPLPESGSRVSPGPSRSPRSRRSDSSGSAVSKTESSSQTDRWSPWIPTVKATTACQTDPWTMPTRDWLDQRGEEFLESLANKKYVVQFDPQTGPKELTPTVYGRKLLTQALLPDTEILVPDGPITQHRYCLCPEKFPEIETDFSLVVRKGFYFFSVTELSFSHDFTAQSLNYETQQFLLWLISQVKLTQSPSKAQVPEKTSSGAHIIC